MFGSIYIGLSGMNAYSKGLQIISNNVANLNTLGFKGNGVTFTDFYNSRGGGSGLSYVRPDQGGVGAGVRSGQSTVNFGQGDLQQSTGGLDLAIQGGGFLVLKDAQGNSFYGRTGQFSVDEKGYISIEGGKYRLSVLDASGQPFAVNLDAKRTSAPAATTTISFAQNVSSTATSVDVPNIAVYDPSGAKHTWEVKLTSAGSGSPGVWTAAVTDETGAAVGSGSITFNNGIIDPAHAKIDIAATTASGAGYSVSLDFSQGVTSYSAGTTSTLQTASVDGHALGQLSDVSVNSAGEVELTYSNGQTQSLGSVALADFRDPQTLEKMGDGLFKSDGSSKMQIVASGGVGVGTVEAKELESSNVDLTQQFGELILVQRGFQASSQVVSVSNDMIQQLFGIRGQG